MIILADKKIPAEAKKKLNTIGRLVEFQTREITYDSISGHPDIFFFKAEEKVIVAPNLPTDIKNKLEEVGVDCTSGEMPVGQKYPGTAFYNAVYVDNYLIHNFRYTDSKITQLAEDAELIHVNQGYARCSIIPLGNKKFITSDPGIYKTLLRYDFEVLLVDPSDIQLPGQKHGFIGGTCGVHDGKLYLLGSLKHFPDGDKTREFVTKAGHEIIELNNGPLFDGGSVLFL